MKKMLKISIMTCMIVTLLAGCGAKANKTTESKVDEKTSTESRVDGKSYTFNAEEFKNYFNEKIGTSAKIKDFKGNKLQDSDIYIYTEDINDCLISATSDTENGKLLTVSVSFNGKKKTKSKIDKKVGYSKAQFNIFEKYASAAFQVCEPNVKINKFEDFFYKKFQNASKIKDDSEEIGDLNVSLITKKNNEFEFKPKIQE